MIWRILSSQVHSLLPPLAQKLPRISEHPFLLPLSAQPHPQSHSHLLAPEQVAIPLAALAPKRDKDQNKTARKALLPLQQHICSSGTSQPVSQWADVWTHSLKSIPRSEEHPEVRWMCTKTTDGAQEKVKDKDTTSHQFHNKEEVGFES